MPWYGWLALGVMMTLGAEWLAYHFWPWEPDDVKDAVRREAKRRASLAAQLKPKS